MRPNELHDFVLAWDAAGRPSKGADCLVKLARTLAPPPVKPAKRAKPKRNDEAIMDAMNAAVRACRNRYGDRWSFVEGETVLIRLPFGSYKTMVKGREATIRCRRDCRAPIASYWPGCAIPDGVIVQADYKHEHAERGWPDDSYDKWQRAWAKRNGLVFSPSEQWHKPVFGKALKAA
jgi:hypothetical protein